MRQHDKKFKISHEIIKIGYFEKGKIFKVSIKIPFCLGWIERVKFSIQNSEQKNLYLMQYIESEDEYARFETTVSLQDCAIYHYYFSFEANGTFQYYKRINITGNTCITKEEFWKLSVGFSVPNWAKGANMYHIFVDRFRKSTNKYLEPMPRRTIHYSWDEPPVIGPNEDGNWNVDFYGGDLFGIIEAIPYLKTLNIDIVYLSPICLSQSNHRYDTADYEMVDYYVGTNNSLKTLCNIAHSYDIKIVLDAVFNHTGNDSKYFNELGTFSTLGAYQSSESPYYDFYVKHWFQGKLEFSYWWGMKNLPECDSNSTHWRNYICGVGGVIDKWFSLGIDGLRLDVADELSDEFIEEIAKAAKRNKPDSLIIGEVWKNPMRMSRNYISSGHGMHSVMNYLLIDALIRYYKYIDISKLSGIINEILSEYPEETIYTLMNFTSTHDISRLIEIFSSNNFQEYSEWAWNLLNDNIPWVISHHLTDVEYSYGKMILKSYITALAFFPGIFSIFYGDEVGIQGIGNLANRASFPWEHKDMDLLDFFKEICRIRHDEAFLKTAKFSILEITPEYFSFERYDEFNSIIVFASRTHHTVNLNINEKYTNFSVIFCLPECSKNVLAPYGAIILKK